jgi:hypothetical protein
LWSAAITQGGGDERSLSHLKFLRLAAVAYTILQTAIDFPHLPIDKTKE